MDSLVGASSEVLLSVNAENGYPVRQENGQRKSGPPPDWPTTRHPPGRGCEVFVGKLPRDCLESDLFPLFERCGPIYEMRLMLDFSGFNRGYAFITYTSRESARRCVKELNQFEIRPNRSIGVCQSVDNCRLFVGGIPKLKKREEILDEIGQVTEGVVDVIVYPSAHDKTKNRGFAFVEYESHRAAAMARRKLLPGKIQLWGQQIAVDWAEPEAEVDEDVMATVRVLYVRNLMITTSEEQIKEIFERYKSNAVERVKKLKDYAFVHFREREDALHAMNLINGREIDGSIVEVTLAKPVDKSQYIRFTRGVTRVSPPILAHQHHRGAYYSILRPNARRTDEKCLEDLYKETYDALLATGAVVAAPPPPPAPFLLIDCFNQQTHFLRAEDQSSLSQQQREEMPPMTLLPPVPQFFPSLFFNPSPSTGQFTHPILLSNGTAMFPPPTGYSNC